MRACGAYAVLASALTAALDLSSLLAFLTALTRRLQVERLAARGLRVCVREHGNDNIKIQSVDDIYKA